MVSKLETKFQNFVATAGSLLVYQRLAAVRPADRPTVTHHMSRSLEGHFFNESDPSSI